MKIERPASPVSLAVARQVRSRLAASYGHDAARHDNSLHGPDRLMVDTVAPVDPDNHETPEFEDAEISRDDALETARIVGHELAVLDCAIANHHATRLQHLFHS